MKENKEKRSYVSPAVEVNSIMVESGFAFASSLSIYEQDPYGEGADFDY